MTSTASELHKDVQQRYMELRTLYRQDQLFKSVVDMYRNLSLEDEVAAHFMAWHDITTYVHEDETFEPLAVGYESRELEFLMNRGVKLI